MLWKLWRPIEFLLIIKLHLSGIIGVDFSGIFIFKKKFLDDKNLLFFSRIQFVTMRRNSQNAPLDFCNQFQDNTTRIENAVNMPTPKTNELPNFGDRYKNRLYFHQVGWLWMNNAIYIFTDPCKTERKKNIFKNNYI